MLRNQKKNFHPKLVNFLNTNTNIKGQNSEFNKPDYFSSLKPTIKESNTIPSLFFVFFLSVAHHVRFLPILPTSNKVVIDESELQNRKLPKFLLWSKYSKYQW